MSGHSPILKRPTSGRSLWIGCTRNTPPTSSAGHGVWLDHAPISKIWELDAAQFANDFVRLTWQEKQPVGAALREIRARASAATSYAYIYYGDVMAKFE